MEKGDIFWAIKRKDHPHPIVFLEQIDRVRFKACILSTKLTHNNILMCEEHFCTNRRDGTDYEIGFDNSYLVPDRVFEKERLWVASDKAQGKLTEEGIRFIEQHVDVDSIKFEFPIKTIPSKAMDVLVTDFECREVKDIVVAEKASGKIFKVVAVAKDGQESTVFFNEKGETVSETGELIQQAQAPAQEEPATPEEPTAPEQPAE